MSTESRPTTSGAGRAFSFGMVASLALFPLVVADVLMLPLWLSGDLATIFVYVTLGLGLLPLMAIPTVLLYLNPIIVTLTVRAAGVIQPAVVWLLGFFLLVATAFGPGVMSLGIEAFALGGLPGSVGEPPAAPPRELRVVTTTQVCDALCMQLLFGGDVDALEQHVPSGRAAGSTVYRRVDATPCPPWRGDKRPKDLAAFERGGRCLVAEPESTLAGAWISWREPDLWFTRRKAAVFEWGVGDARTGRATYVDRAPIAFPTRFKVTMGSTVSLGLAREAAPGHQPLERALRKVIGYTLQPLVLPVERPDSVIRFYLGQSGALGKPELDAIEAVLPRLGTSPEDVALMGALLADARVHGVYRGFERVSRDRPDVLVPHVDALLAILEDAQRASVDKSAVAKALAALPLPALAPHGARVLALTEPTAAGAANWVHAPLLLVVGRLGVDPTAALAAGLANDREEVVMAAAGGLCNADSQWASPHLDTAAQALAHRHSSTTTLRLARALVRHGRRDAVERHLEVTTEAERRRLNDGLKRTWADPAGGCAL